MYLHMCCAYVTVNNSVGEESDMEFFSERQREVPKSDVKTLAPLQVEGFQDNVCIKETFSINEDRSVDTPLAPSNWELPNLTASVEGQYCY